MSLTDFEKTVLARVATYQLSPGCHTGDIAVHIADELRKALPDIDDITLARVLCHLAMPAFIAADQHQLPGVQLAAILRRAAADLAALELGDRP